MEKNKKELFLEKACENIRPILKERLHYSRMRRMMILTISRKELLEEINRAVKSAVEEVG